MGPDTCQEICNDGKDFHNYECDDGQIDGANGLLDGCDDNCNIVACWDCAYGEPNVEDFCWKLDLPTIIDADISEDNSVILILFNVTTLALPDTNMEDHFEIKLTGPR